MLLGRQGPIVPKVLSDIESACTAGRSLELLASILPTGISLQRRNQNRAKSHSP